MAQLYTELPFLERFGAAARDGFQGVEFRGAYDQPKDVLIETLARAGVKLVLFNLPPGNWAAGDRGIACHLGREAEFDQSVETAIDHATALGCAQLNCMVGLVPSGVSAEQAEETLVSNLRRAAARTMDAGIKLQIEPLNRLDNPGCLLSDTAHFERIHNAVGSANLFLQYDFYHMQIMQGDLVRNFERLQPLIAHVQVADNPGRHEPGTGEINYAFIFSALERLGYEGWIGCEYVPSTDTSVGLGWLSAALDQRAAAD